MFRTLFIDSKQGDYFNDIYSKIMLRFKILLEKVQFINTKRYRVQYRYPKYNSL